MFNLNDLIMALFAGFLLWASQYIPMAPLINLLFNFLIIGILVLYILQCFGVIKILPTPKIFK
jgi:hypothetical protein